MSSPRPALGRRVVAVALPLALLTAACGGSSGGSAAGPSDAATTTEVPAALASYFPGTKATGEAVKIGLIAPEGGATVNLPESRVAAEVARDYANEQLGGIGGRPIEYVECKSAEDAASARDCANQMVEAKVAAVIVTTTSQGDAMAPVIAKAGIPYVSASGASPAELASPGSAMWTGGFPGVLVSMAKYAAGKGFKKVNFFAPDLPTVTGGITQLGGPVFKAAGIEIVVTPLPLGAADTSPQVASALKQKPDANAIIGDATVCIGVLKGLQTVGSTVPNLLIQPCLDEKVSEAVGSALDGSTVFTTFDVHTDDVEAQLFRYVMGRYDAKAQTSGYAGVGYQGALTLFRAVKGVSGTVDAAALSTALKASKAVPIAAGHGATATCDGKQFPQLAGLCSVGTLVTTVENGKPGATTIG